MNMEVYHGSLEMISNPEIRLSNRILDYGVGFYTTTDYNQASDWVRCHSRMVQHGYVNIYVIDMETVRLANTLWFDEPNDQWINFVDNNRNSVDFSHGYDFVL